MAARSMAAWVQRPISRYWAQQPKSRAPGADHRGVHSHHLGRLPRALAALLVVGVLGVLWPTAAVRAEPSPAAGTAEPIALVSLSDPTGLADSELIEALQSTGLIDEWFASSAVSQTAAVLRVQGSSEYEELRLASISEMFSTVGAERDQEALAAQSDVFEREVDARSDALERAADQVFANDREMIAAATALATARSERDAHAAEVEAKTNDLALARQALLDGFDRMHQMRMTATSPVDELPLVTLDAYVMGAEELPQRCSVDWTLLAGIGRIESLHGTLGGASVSANGAVSPRVFGPLLDGGATERGIESAAAAEAAAAEALAAEEAAAAAIAAEKENERRERELFGIAPTPTPTPDPADEPTEEEALLDLIRESNRVERPAPVDEEVDAESDDDEDQEEGNGFAVIADTDAGRLDGNSDWDRAVGPMQFIPRTWKLFGVDGNGDGVLDPHNFHDATASAANYLCSLERRNGPDPSVFVLGYNDSTSYVDDVIETSERLDDTYQLPVVTTEGPAD